MFISHLFPQYIGSFSTPYNPSIRIYELNGRPNLYVGGSPQSGSYIEYLWKSVLDKFSSVLYKYPAKNILVFGVGGGTVIKLLLKRYPDSVVTAVDIDETMIMIAKHFFHMDVYKNIHFICHDAKSFIQTKKDTYDCIVVDVCSGRHIPSFIIHSEFLRHVKKALNKNGRVLVNYLREFEYREKSYLLEKELHKQFFQVKDFEIKQNRFFFASSFREM